MSVILSDAAARLAAKLLDDEISRGGAPALADYHLLMLELATVDRARPATVVPVSVPQAAAPAVAAAPATFPSVAPVTTAISVDVVAGEAVSPHASAPPHASPTV